MKSKCQANPLFLAEVNPENQWPLQSSHLYLLLVCKKKKRKNKKPPKNVVFSDESWGLKLYKYCDEYWGMNNVSFIQEYGLNLWIFSAYV